MTSDKQADNEVMEEGRDGGGSPAGLSDDDMRGMSACMDNFSRTFEASARRWELVVYPTLLAFIILAAYGFYLIFRLTTDVGHITSKMDVIADGMVTISKTMPVIAQEMKQINMEINQQGKALDVMAVTTGDMARSVDLMTMSTASMDQSMGAMVMTMNQMQYDTALMGHNLHSASGPMRFMNNFMPW